MADFVHSANVGIARGDAGTCLVNVGNGARAAEQWRSASPGRRSPRLIFKKM